MTNQIYLGLTTEKSSVYLRKHQWDCDWYWAFGYLSSPNCHYHIENYLKSEYLEVKEVFKKTWINQSQWYVIRDLFIQAYSIKKTAETYLYGGHQTSDARKYSIIDDDMNYRLNKDLETLLDRIWDYLSEEKKKYDQKQIEKEQTALELADQA